MGLYEKQLLDASRFVKVFKREAPNVEVHMPSFTGRGHFQCECEGIPGLTMHGYYNTLVFIGFNTVTEQYEPMWRIVVNRRDSWWEERGLDDDLKRYVCQQPPSFFKLGSVEEYYLSWGMIQDVRMYVRMLGSKHWNDIVYFDSLVDGSVYDVTNYDVKLFVWMAKMPGIYVDPVGWNPIYYRPILENVRAYNQSRFEEMVYAYKILEDQGDLGPVLKPLQEEKNIGQEESISSQVNSAVATDSPSVEEPTHDFSTTSAAWSTADLINSGIFSSNFELGEYEPTILESDDPNI